MPYYDSPSWTKDNQEYPVSPDGHQLHYPSYYAGNASTWRKNEVFKDTLVYDSFSRGRSAAYFEFTRKSTGTKVVVFLKDMEEMFRVMVRGSVTGSFTFCKRGQNYGCKLAK